jgi:hypothetical protein
LESNIETLFSVWDPKTNDTTMFSYDPRLVSTFLMFVSNFKYLQNVLNLVEY